MDQARGGRISPSQNGGIWREGSSSKEVPRQTEAGAKKASASRQGALATSQTAQPPGHGQESLPGPSGQQGHDESTGPSGLHGQGALLLVGPDLLGSFGLGSDRLRCAQCSHFPEIALSD